MQKGPLAEFKELYHSDSDVNYILNTKDNRLGITASRTYDNDETLSIHTALMSCCNATSLVDFEIKLKSLAKIIDDQEIFCLLALWKNNFSPFDDVLSVLYDQQKNKKTAGQISLKLLSLLINKIKATSSLNALATRIQDNCMIVSSMLLEKALGTGDPEVAALIITLLNEEDFKTILRKNLEQYETSDRSMLLQLALATGNTEVVSQILTWLEDEDFKTILRRNLEKETTSDNSRPLHNAIMLGDLYIINKIIELSENHLIKPLWKILLTWHSKDGHNLFHCAAKKPDFKIFMKVIDAIRKAYPETAEKIIEKLTNETAKNGSIPRFACLQIEEFLIPYREQQLLEQAIDMSNSEDVSNVAVLLLSPGFEKILKGNLQSITKDGLMPLYNALKSGKPEIALNVIELLEQVEVEILIDNLQNTSENAFTPLPLHEAFRLGDLLVITKIVELSKQHLQIEILQSMLNMRSRKNYNLLHHAVIKNDFDIFLCAINIINDVYSINADNQIALLANEQTRDRNRVIASSSCEQIEAYLNKYRTSLNIAYSPKIETSFTPYYKNEKRKSPKLNATRVISKNKKNLPKNKF